MELDLLRAWKAEWFEIISDNEVLSPADFIPHTVEVKAVPSDILPTMRVWKGLELEMERAKQQRQVQAKRAKRKRASSKSVAGRQGPKRARAIAAAVGPDTANQAEALDNAEDSDPNAEAASDHASEASAQGSDLEDEEGVQTTAGPADTSAMREWEKLAELAERHPSAAEAALSFEHYSRSSAKGQGPASKAKGQRRCKGRWRQYRCQCFTRCQCFFTHQAGRGGDL